MTAPVVSVLLPFHNAVDTLDAAVESIVSQQGVEWELIAVDDASNDGGTDRMKQWACRDARIVLAPAPRRGIVSALDTAASLARGEFLARMDADDVSLPGRLAAQCEALSADEALAAVATQVRSFPDGAGGEGLRRYLAWQNGVLSANDHARELFVESPYCHPSVMMRADAFARVGGYRDVPWPEDYDLWLRFDRAGYRLAKLPAVYLHWRIRAGQLTFSDPRYAVERFLDAKAAHLGPRLEKMGRPFAVWGAGPTGRKLARALERNGHRARCFVDIDPRKVGRTARGVAIVGPDALDRARECVIVAVGARGARDLIRAELVARGWREGDDFLCAS